MIGIDGCRAGWCGAALGANGRVVFAVDARFEVVVQRLVDSAACAPDARILVDMPIGLADGGATRECDDLARRALGARRASLFAAPPRAVLGARDHAAANALARASTGRGLSLQSWNLVPRITELDALLARDPALAARTFESHPELCFARLLGRPAAHGKRTEAGRAERLVLLERLAPGAARSISAARAAQRSSAAGVDDYIDALVLALSSALPAERLEHLPDPPQLDATGRRMSIVAPRAAAHVTGPT